MKLFFSTKILLLFFYISNISYVLSEDTKPFGTFKIDKKRHMAYPLLIHKSEIIVQGYIVKVNKDSYSFKITGKLKGINEKKEIVIVNKWEHWSCDSRRLPYKIGQKALLFLTKDSDYTISIKNKDINKNNYNVFYGSNGEFIINTDNTIRKNFYSSLY